MSWPASIPPTTHPYQQQRPYASTSNVNPATAAAVAAAAYQYSQSYASYVPPPPTPIQQTPAKQVDAAAVNSSTASEALNRFLTSQLETAGFQGSHPSALNRLHVESVAYLELLYKQAHEYANLSNRPAPTMIDLVRVCIDRDLQPRAFRKTLKRAERKHSKAQPVTLAEPSERTPSPELLESDEDTTAIHIPPTLRYLPPHFPPLPARHTYLRTPITTSTKKALPSLEKKQKNAGLVQESLKSLIIATEDTSGPEDADLVGHVVNWENAVSARKRWRWNPPTDNP